MTTATEDGVVQRALNLLEIVAEEQGYTGRQQDYGTNAITAAHNGGFTPRPRLGETSQAVLDHLVEEDILAPEGKGYGIHESLLP